MRTEKEAGGEGGVEDGVTKIRRGVGFWMEGGGGVTRVEQKTVVVATRYI